MKINIVYFPEGWILDKITDEITKIKSENMSIKKSTEVDYDADINYFVNWKVFKLNQKKSKKDGCWFTHFETSDAPNGLIEGNLKKMDFITAMSSAGKQELITAGIDESKISVVWGMGVSPNLNLSKKIILGMAGRPYAHTSRKGEDVLIRLSKDLNNKVFEFIFKGNHWLSTVREMLSNGMTVSIIEDDNFFYAIDYYLQSSYTEGGAMDILNAVYVGLPVISRDTGFIFDLKTAEDIIFKDYDDLLRKLKKIEKIKLEKMEKIKVHTWQNFRNYHKDLFLKIGDE